MNDKENSLLKLKNQQMITGSNNLRQKLVFFNLSSSSHRVKLDYSNSSSSVIPSSPPSSALSSNVTLSFVPTMGPSSFPLQASTLGPSAVLPPMQQTSPISIPSQQPMGGSSQAETASGPLGLTTLELAAVGVGGFLICLALMFFAVRVYGIFYKLPWTSDAETSGDKEIELERGYKYAADTHTEPTNTNEEPEVTHKRNRRANASSEIDSLYAFIGENKRYSKFRGSMPARNSESSSIDSAIPPKVMPKPSRKQEQERIEMNPEVTDESSPPQVVPAPPPLPPPARVTSTEKSLDIDVPPPTSPQPRSFFMPRSPTVNPLSLDKDPDGPTPESGSAVAVSSPSLKKSTVVLPPPMVKPTVVLPPPAVKPAVTLPPPMVKPAVVLPPPATAPKPSLMSWFAAAPAQQPNIEPVPIGGGNPFDTDLDDMPAYPPPMAPVMPSSLSSAKPEKPAKPVKPARVSRKDQVDAQQLLEHKKSIQSAFSVPVSSSEPGSSSTTPTKPAKPPKSPRTGTQLARNESNNPFDRDLW